jgi:hypothetical protein
MATLPEPQFTASIVISSEHAGLRPHFKGLEHEIYRVLARVHGPAAAGAYAMHMIRASRQWHQQYQELSAEK